MKKSSAIGFGIFFFILGGNVLADTPDGTKYRFSTQSLVCFDAKSTLHDFEGKTQKVGGEFSVDWDKVENSKGGFFEVQATGLETGNSDRDKTMKAHCLEVNRFPLITFQSTSCRGHLNPDSQKPSQLILAGNLTIHGVSQKVEVPVTVLRLDPQHVRLRGKVPVRLSDYKIHVPSVLGLIKMEDQVMVKFDLAANSEQGN